MEIVSTKIVNGKKMYLIDDTSNKLFANNGENVNPYYVPIQEINSSDNTKTKLTPKQELSKKEIQQLKTSPTAVQNIRDREKFEKEERLRKSEQAYQKRIKTGIQSSQDLADETGAIGDKISLQNIPGVGQYIPNILDVTQGIGNMASGLGRIPLNLEKGNYGQAALDVAIPLGVGALAGVGTENTGQFVNNIVNPLAGTGELINNLGNKYLPNVYKINPWAFKPSSDNLYRGLGESGVKDAFETGVLRPRPAELADIEDIVTESGKIFRLKSKTFNKTYYSPYFKTVDRYGHGYIAEVPKNSATFNNRYSTGKDWSMHTTEQIPIDKANILKKDWLMGYKKINAPKKQFKSEIDWGKWNKEIPQNTELMKEYSAIEQTTKANGSWMKNPDGSKFQGTPEQFVQQNSQNFKKAFPDGFENVFRGVSDKTVVKELNPERSMFTADFDLASNYTRNKEILTPFDQFNTLDKSQFNPNVKEGMFNLAHKKSPKSIELDNFGREWTSIDLTNPKQSISNIELNIKHLEEHIERQKEFLKSGKQNLDGSWSFPDTDIVYSNQLYKEGTKAQEKIINSYKDRLKNINNLVKNEKELEKMKSVLGNKTTTDDIAKYIEDSNLDYVKIKNVDDSGLGDVSIVNHKKGNYLKSLVGNNGVFDMTNPNIYKTLIPGAMTLGALNQTNEKQFGGTVKVLDTKIEKNKKYYLINE